MFGMGQSKANQWIPVLLAALRVLGEAPARSLTALAQRLGVAEDDMATMVVLPEEAPAGVPVSPLLPMTGPNDASSAPKTLLNRRDVIAARKGPYGKKCPARQCPPQDPFSQCNLGRPRA
jgi:hypothetical protein